MVADLSISLFGPFQVTLDGAPVDFESDKVRALLAFLAAEPGTHHRREKLAGLLWPGGSDQSARNNLRHTLAVLRKAIGDRDAQRPVLNITRQTVQFEPSAAVRVDLLAFGDLLQASGPDALEAWQQATGLYQGDFLQDLSLPDSPEFEEWALLSREQFRRQALDAFFDLARALEEQGRCEDALDHARRQIELDPCREEAHAQAMRLLARSGRRSEALAQYQACRRILAEELGVEPSGATARLYEQVRIGDVEAAGAPAPGAAARTAAKDLPGFLTGAPDRAEKPVFVAREQELAHLQHYLALALAGQGRVVFVTGDAGSGKTALVQEFARRAQEAHASPSSATGAPAAGGEGLGLVFAAGNCNAQTGVGDPYLPFREVLELLTGDVEARWAAGAMTGDHARQLWRTLPAAAQALVEVGPDLIDTFVPGQALLRRAATSQNSSPAWLARLQELVEPKAPGLVVPSPQQSDLFEQYSRVLQALARRAPLLIFLDDLQWADLGSTSLLFHLGRQLAGHRILVVGAYRPVEVVLGRPGPSAGTGQAARHPLEPVANEFARLFGDVTVEVGRAEGQEFVDALLDTEPNRLGPGYREMLYQQTRGHPLFTLELLHGMQERGDLVKDRAGRWIEGANLDWQTLPARVEGAIAERIHRLDEDLQAVLRVASVEGEAFTAEVIAQVLGADPRRLVQRLSHDLDRRHRLVRAQAIERLGPSTGSGQGSGRRLSRYRFRHTLSQKYLYDRLDTVERTYLHEDVGSALEAIYGDDGAGLVAIAPQLAHHFQEAGLDEKAIRYLHQAGERALQLSAYQEALDYLQQGLALFLTLPEAGGAAQQRARAEQELALQLALGMSWMGIKGKGFPAPELRDCFSRARVLCQELGREEELSRVLGELSMSYFVQAQHPNARELAEQALDLARRAEDPFFGVMGHWYLGVIMFAQGEYTTALEQLDQITAFYDPQAHHQAFVHLRGSDPGPSAMAYQACCLWCLGYPDQALARSREAIALACELDHPFTLADVLCYAGCLVDSMRQDVEALALDADALLDVSRRADLPWLPSALRYQSEANLMQDPSQEALIKAREAMAATRSSGQLCHGTGIYCAIASAYLRRGQPEEGLEAIDEVLAIVGQSEERVFEAEIHRLRAELLLLKGDTAAAEASFLQAIEVARRQEARSWELRAANGLARLWRRLGKADQARQMLAPIYGQFGEGFDTPDLQEAKALLEL